LDLATLGGGECQRECEMKREREGEKEGVGRKSKKERECNRWIMVPTCVLLKYQSLP